MFSPVAFYLVLEDGTQIKCLPRNLSCNIGGAYDFDTISVDGYVEKDSKDELNLLKDVPIHKLLEELKRRIKTKENLKG